LTYRDPSPLLLANELYFLRYQPSFQHDYTPCIVRSPAEILVNAFFFQWETKASDNTAKLYRRCSSRYPKRNCWCYPYNGNPTASCPRLENSCYAEQAVSPLFQAGAVA
jgi:hypothetical protein